MFTESWDVSVSAMNATPGRYPVLPRVGLGCLVTLVVGLLIVPLDANHALSSVALLVVIAATVAIGVVGAIFVEIAGHLTQCRRAVWMSAALGLYSVTVVPFATVQTVSARLAATLTGSRPVAYWVVVVFLVLAAYPPRRPAKSVGVAVAVAGCGVLALATTPVIDWAWEIADVAMSMAVARAALVIAGCCLVITLVVTGGQGRTSPLDCIGLGLVVATAAQEYGIVFGMPVSAPNLVFSTISLIGLTLVAIGSFMLARRGWHQHWEDSLQVPAGYLKHVARQITERDHELRNALASLSGCHVLLGEALEADHARQLRQAVESELRRLESMLEGRGAAARTQGYPVAPVLARLVTLRQAAGADVELDVDERLRAGGSPDVLAQVVTNLLINCERHAPGSPVRIRASECQHRVLVEVTDGGAGISATQRETVLEHGVHTGHAHGSGLGLHICRQLLTAQGGALFMLDPSAGQTGWTVLVELPPATASTA